MDTVDIADFLAPFVPALYAGREATGAGAEFAARLWTHLSGPLTATPSRIAAVIRLAENPDDLDARRVFSLELTRLLAADAVLERDVTELWAVRAQPSSPAPPSGPEQAAPAESAPAKPGDLDEADRSAEESGTYPSATNRRGFDAPISDEPSQASIQPPDPAGSGESSGPEDKRAVHAWLADADPERPWLVTLVVGVGSGNAPRGGAFVPFDNQRVFGPGEEFVVLDVVVTSADFLVDTGPQLLRVPRTGPSRNLARFDLTISLSPRMPLEGTVTVYLYKSGNFVQALVLRLRVGADGREIAHIDDLHRLPLGSTAALRPRQLSLVIRRAGEGYDLTAFGALSAHLTLRITAEQLERIIHEGREVLKEVVDFDGGGGKRVFQETVSVSGQAREAALARLAEAGLLMYRAIFYQRPDAATTEFGERMCALADRESLKIQVVSDDFFLPWGMLYLASADEYYDRDAVRAERFLGFRHVIEHILISTPSVPLSLEISTSPRVSVSCNVDRGIDQDFSISAVADQLAYWEDLQRSTSTTGTAVQVHVRSTAEEVRRALDDPATKDQIWYFYCHANDGSLLQTNKADASFLKLSDQSRLVLSELYAGRLTPLPGNPLILLNACGSATLSPLFYRGFLPYFMMRGARGLVGTECDVPALFAAEWAQRFFEKFLAGGYSLGRTLLDLRGEFLEQENNPLGLVYALYCDADTTTAPGVFSK
jgi:hypothetical protein